MFEWLRNLFSGMAYNAAISSYECASYHSMHQMKEPVRLQQLAAEKRNK